MVFGRSYDEDEEFRKAEERRALGWERKQLQFLLSQPLIAKSTHTKYPTKSGQMVWPYLEGQLCSKLGYSLLLRLLRPAKVCYEG